MDSILKWIIDYSGLITVMDDPMLGPNPILSLKAKNNF
jgi:hypothetical protein